MRVLIVTTPLPTPTHPDTMAPLARQIKSLRELGIVMEVLEVRGDTGLKYLSTSHRRRDHTHPAIPNKRQNRTVTIAFVDLATQHAQVKTEIMDAVQRVMDTGQFILGDELQAFEEEFAEYCGTLHCVGVGSGTDALHLALRAYGVGPGDEVITAANTFIATAFAICHTGATPVLVDIEPDGNNMDVRLLERAITAKTKAVIPVHLFGQPANMEAMREVAHEHGLVVLEDACQAHGARYKGARAGSLGDAACFSFYPAKNL